MIAKLIPRKHGRGSFRDSVNYNLGLSRNDKDKVEYVNTLNIFAPEAAAAEMEAVALENALSRDPVFNCVLSWRENEIPTRKQADGAVHIVLEELGLRGCQVHYALHRNTENLHLHICVNRIDPETCKARDPAGGWTKKALEKAARKIELAQGWEIERSGRYIVTENGEILEKSREENGLKLSQTARDIEAHTAAKSAERIGQEYAAPTIRSARSWEELHGKLAEQGIAFEKKGGGAVLRIASQNFPSGETIIKASLAGRDISLSKLEKRLGSYRERDASVVIETSKPEAVGQVEAEPKLKSSWKEFQEAKSAYFSTKKRSFSGMTQRHREERGALYTNQRREYSTLFSVSWKNRGAELNRRRSVMAAQQQKEKLELRDRQREEREKLKKRFPRQFPSFKAWLNMEENLELSALYRYPGQLILFSGGGEEQPAGKKTFDLRDYSPVYSGKLNGVMYCREDQTVADFIDYGKKIVLAKECGEAAVLSALQLANQKWGAVQVNGTDEYKRLCVRMAGEHNIRLANPDLKAEVDALRESKIQDIGTKDQYVDERKNEKSYGWSR
jgi:hypothetical protein